MRLCWGFQLKEHEPRMQRWMPLLLMASSCMLHQAAKRFEQLSANATNTSEHSLVDQQTGTAFASDGWLCDGRCAWYAYIGFFVWYYNS
jgi:hypothetical protein